jgi:hypothetical protein
VNRLAFAQLETLPFEASVKNERRVRSLKSTNGLGAREPFDFRDPFFSVLPRKLVRGAPPKKRVSRADPFAALRSQRAVMVSMSVARAGH